MPSSIDYAKIADFYDTFVKVDFDVPFFIEEARKASGEVLELMSGTGRVSIPLVEAGVSLTCIDNSPEMLAVLHKKLKERAVDASIYQMDVRELNLGKQFDLIIIPFHSFAELLSPSDQKKALANACEHLSRRGSFICTLHNPSVRVKPVDGRPHLLGAYPLPGGKRRLLVWLVENYEAASHLVRGIELLEEYDTKGVMQSKRMLDIRFYLFRRGEFERLAKSVGFKVTALYGDYQYSDYNEKDSPFMIWVLQK